MFFGLFVFLQKHIKHFWFNLTPKRTYIVVLHSEVEEFNCILGVGSKMWLLIDSDPINPKKKEQIQLRARLKPWTRNNVHTKLEDRMKRLNGNLDLDLNQLAIISLMKFYRRPIWIVAPKELFIHLSIPKRPGQRCLKKDFETLCALLAEKKLQTFDLHTRRVCISMM